MGLGSKFRLLKDHLQRHPGSLVNIARSGTDLALEPDRTLGSPTFLEIEPTIQCNLKCIFCVNPFLTRARAQLSLEQFRKILDQFPSLMKISLVGIGESFMNRDLFKMIQEARSRGIEIGTTTNGTILTDAILQEILSSDLQWLNFSLDGATKTTYERLRPGAVFEKVLANIQRVAAAVAESPQPRPALTVWFVANKENIQELPQMIPLVQELGVHRLSTQGLHYWGHPDFHDRAVQASAIQDLKGTLLRVERQAAESGVEFNWQNFPDQTAARGCKWPWKGSYITADGFVTPCCENGSDPDRINFGNLFERPYAEIWNSEKYRQFRRQLRSTTERPDICVDCPSYHKPIVLNP